MIRCLHTADVHVVTFGALLPDAAHVVRADFLDRARAEGINAVAADVKALLRDMAGTGPVLCTCSTLGPLVDELGLANIVRIDRPAICSPIPADKGHTHVLDLGANIDSTAEHLYQFAVMGSELARAVDGIENPSVGLLNIGQEDIKGNEQVKAANRLLRQGKLNYIGYVEGDDIFSNRVDVVVCDGFVGNVALKTTEGLAKMLASILKKEFTRNWLTKLMALVAMPVLKSVQKQFDPRLYNGASFLGLQGIVIKSHGGADSLSYANAISVARKEIIAEVPKKIRHRLQALVDQGQTKVQ